MPFSPRFNSRRKQHKGMIDNVQNALLRMGADPNKVQGFKFMDEAHARAHSIQSLPELTAELMPYFWDKCWALYSTTRNDPFYIADNPVTMFNSNRDPLRGTLGLRVPGI